VTAIVTFCEAFADFRAVRSLVDRVLREHGEPWIRDLLEDPAARESFRPFLGESEERPFYDVHRLPRIRKDLEKELGRPIRVPQGRFDGKPGAAMALQGRTIFQMMRALSAKVKIGAVIVVVDMDDDPRGRREGLSQARDEAASWGLFRIVHGHPDPTREAWILAGFVPERDEEETLSALRKALGFSPCDEPHRLRDKDARRGRNIKDVLAALTKGDTTREDRCLEECPLDLLESRGKEAGLADFTAELRRELLPLFNRRPA